MFSYSVEWCRTYDHRKLSLSLVFKLILIVIRISWHKTINFDRLWLRHALVSQNTSLSFMSWYAGWLRLGCFYIYTKMVCDMRSGLPTCLRISNHLGHCIIQMSICNTEISEMICPSMIVLWFSYFIRYLVVCIWTHRHRDMHICVGELDNYWFK